MALNNRALKIPLYLSWSNFDHAVRFVEVDSAKALKEFKLSLEPIAREILVWNIDEVYEMFRQKAFVQDSVDKYDLHIWLTDDSKEVTSHSKL